MSIVEIPSRGVFSNADREAVEIGELYRKARASAVDSVKATYSKPVTGF